MKFLLALSFLALQVPAMANTSCNFGASNSGLWPDHQRELEEKEADCKARQKKPIQLAADADEKTTLEYFKRDCDRGSNGPSTDPHEPYGLYEQEQDCLKQKLAEHKELKAQKKAPSKDRCELEEGVAYYCPEGVYKFQGSNDLKHVNDALRSIKEVPTSSPKKKTNTKSSAVKQ